MRYSIPWCNKGRSNPRVLDFKQISIHVQAHFKVKMVNTLNVDADAVDNYDDDGDVENYICQRHA